MNKSEKPSLIIAFSPYLKDCGNKKERDAFDFAGLFDAPKPNRRDYWYQSPAVSHPEFSVLQWLLSIYFCNQIEEKSKV